MGQRLNNGYKKLLKELNTDELMEMLEEINSYDGYFDEMECFEFDDSFFDCTMGTYSQTTSRHQKEFFKQFGYSKKIILMEE